MKKKKPYRASNEAHLAERAKNLSAPTNITPALIGYLTHKFPPSLIAEKIGELMEAIHITKGGDPIPDNRAREAGLKLLISYLVGLPVQRQEIVQLNFDSLEELQKRAQQSPTIQAAVARVLAPIPAKDVQNDGPLESPLVDSK